MSDFSHGKFQSLWTAAVVLVALMAFATVLIVSFTKAPAGAEASPTPAAAATPAADQGTVIIPLTPEPTAEPTAEPEAGGETEGEGEAETEDEDETQE